MAQTLELFEDGAINGQALLESSHRNQAMCKQYQEVPGSVGQIQVFAKGGGGVLKAQLHAHAIARSS